MEAPVQAQLAQARGNPDFQQRFEAEASSEHTILEYLNEDCWREILKHFSLREIIQTEWVSRRWQRVVLVYLSNFRIGIEHPFFGSRQPHIFLMGLDEIERAASFVCWTAKLGCSVVSLHWWDQKGLDVIGENCPNLETITLYKSPKLPSEYSGKDSFQSLQRFTVYYSNVPDLSMSQFLHSNTLVEIKFLCNEGMTGECLNYLQSTKLKSIVMNRCYNVKIAPMLSATSRLGSLTKLVLKRVSGEIGQNAHLLLERLPRLEYLHVQTYMRQDYKMDSCVFFESVCVHGNLRYLNVDYEACDVHLEAVMASCQQLQALHLKSCREVTGRGLQAVCRHAGERLTELGICKSIRLNDDDIVACVKACRNLTSLILDGCIDLSLFDFSKALLGRIVAARRALPSVPCLNLHTNANYHGPSVYCAGILKIDTNDPSHDSDWVAER